jgi:hypothetical protein
MVSSVTCWSGESINRNTLVMNSTNGDMLRQEAVNSRRNFCRNGYRGGNGGQQLLFNQGKGKLGEQFGWTYGAQLADRRA